MKKLGKAFVIIDIYGGESSYFMDFISFDEAEISKKCASLNRALNAPLKKKHDAKAKIKKYMNKYNPIVRYVCKDMAQAIEGFGDMVADLHTEHDASY